MGAVLAPSWLASLFGDDRDSEMVVMTVVMVCVCALFVVSGHL